MAYEAGKHSTEKKEVPRCSLIPTYAGCDVINMSLGGSNSWNEDPAAVVADRISERNVTGNFKFIVCIIFSSIFTLVVVAAGNEGDKGAYMVSSPSTGKRVISVASIDNNYSLQRTMRLVDSADDDANSSFRKSMLSKQTKRITYLFLSYLYSVRSVQHHRAIPQRHAGGLQRPRSTR